MCSPRSACCSAGRRLWPSTSTASCAPGVTAKDLILAIIGKIGVAGGTGHVIEYRGAAIRALDMDERMTVCNMSIEAGARAGMIAPDETTFAYLEGRAARAARARPGTRRRATGARCRPMPARAFDREVDDRRVGARADDHLRHESRHGRRRSRGTVPARSDDPVFDKALAYMGFDGRRSRSRGAAGQRRVHRQLHQRAALRPARRRRRAARAARSRSGVQMLVVPGSQQVKKRRRSRRARSRVPRRRRRVARVAAARCASA